MFDLSGRKVIISLLFTLLSLIVILLACLLIVDAEKKQEVVFPSDPYLRGDISLSNGGVYMQSTSSGDLWIYATQLNKVYYIQKPDATGEIKVTTRDLPAK